MHILLLLFVLCLGFSAFGQTITANSITPNQVVERQIGLKESHQFQFSLKSGEYVRFEIEQKNVDPQLVITDSGGTILRQIYFEKIAGKTAISFIASDNAGFVLMLKPSGRSKLNGNYRLQMHEPRIASDLDRQRIEAEKILNGSGFRAFQQKTRVERQTPEQRLNRLTILQKLAENWQNLNEPLFEQETWNQIGNIAGKTGNAELKQTAFEKVLKIARQNKDMVGEALAFYHLGYLAENRGELETALKNYLSAAELAQMSGAKVVEIEILGQLGNYYRNQSQNEKATAVFQQILGFYGEVKSEVDEAKAKLSWAITIDDIDSKNYARVFEESLKVFEKNEAFYEKANVLRILGSDAADGGQFEIAEKYFTESLVLMEKYGDPSDEAFPLLSLGLLRFTQSKPAEARELLEKALAKLTDGTDFLIRIKVVKALARIDSSQGKLDEAVKKLKTAYEIADKLKLPKEQIEINALLSVIYLAIGQNDEALKIALLTRQLSEATKNKYFQAVAANALGRIYHLQGNYPQAIILFEETIKFTEGSKQTRVNALGYQTLGAVYYELGDFPRAEQNTLKAIAVLEKTATSLDKLLAAALLAQIFLRQEKFAEAKAKLVEILELAKATKNRLIEAQAEMLLGNLALKERNFNESSQKFSAALNVNVQIKAVVGIALSLKGLGESFYGLENFGQAQNIYGQTLGVFRQIGSPTGESAIFENLMNLENKKGNKRLAVFYGKQSVNLLQNVRGNIKTLEAEIRKNFLSSVETSYRTLAALLIDEGRISEAQHVLSLLKQEEFYQFTQRSPESFTGTPNQLALTKEETEAAQKYKELTDKITVITKRVTDLEIEQRGQPLSAEKQAEKQKLQLELVALNTGFVKYLQELAGVFNQTAPPEKVELINAPTKVWQKKLGELGAENVLLTTLVAENRYYVIMTTPTTQIARNFEISPNVLNQKIKKMREVLENPRTEALSATRELYQILVKPIEADLEKLNAKNLLWSLDGALRYVPFAALHDGQKHLVEKYTNVVVTLAQPPKELYGLPQNWRALGAGISVAFEEFEPLVNVPGELKSIVRDETAKNSKTEKGIFAGKRLLDQEFSRENLTNALTENFQLVHFATHFVFRPGKDIDSFLLLGNGEKLSLAELRRDNSFNFSNLDLLTLSACETAFNAPNANGVEVESLGVIAQRRGAKSILASLWAIKDNVTPKLMEEFYRRYESGNGRISKAEALRQAQITLLKKGKINQNFAHPAYWAPFIILGEWR